MLYVAYYAPVTYWQRIFSFLSIFPLQSPIYPYYVYREVPTHMKRVAGKTLPLEKLAVYRAQSYVKGEYVAMPLAVSEVNMCKVALGRMNCGVMFTSYPTVYSTSCSLFLPP